MTKVMLIAGVAALAIAAPALAGPHGGHGGGNPYAGKAFAAPNQARGGGGFGGFAKQNRSGGGFAAARMQARQQVKAQQRANVFLKQRQAGAQRQARAFQMQRQARAMQVRQNQQRQARAFQLRQNGQRQARAFQMRQNQQRQARAFQQNRQQQARVFRQRNQMRQAQLLQQRQFRNAQAQQRQAFTQNRFARAQQMQQARQMQQFAAQRQAQRAQMTARQFANNDFANRFAKVRNAGYVNGCPPGLAAKNNGCLPPGQAMRLLGAPISTVASLAPLSQVPKSLRYLYADTPNYYYQYGNGYMYQVDRNSNLVDALLPLVGGGYLPGMTLPASYMNSYVPNYYGLNSFYPDTPYANYRYMDGNVYGIDPYSGAIQDVIPTYAYGYGVGQMLPAGYDYYNVPTDYRSLYYNTPDANYWYAPGAIYNVDPNTQLITSVASLLAPGLAVGQALPMGYSTYNVPMAYRSTYYDTPNAWYRYNNGNIYQVDPTTQMVTGIVASLLT